MLTQLLRNCFSIVICFLVVSFPLLLFLGNARRFYVSVLVAITTLCIPESAFLWVMVTYAMVTPAFLASWKTIFVCLDCLIYLKVILVLVTVLLS